MIYTSLTENVANILKYITKDKDYLLHCFYLHVPST